MAVNKKLKDIQKQLDKAYEKQCFYASKGYGEYPEPEKSNPDREIKKEIEPERNRPEIER